MSTASSSKRWIGFDLGGTKMLSIAYDEQFQKLGKRRRKTKGHEGAETGLKRIVETIHQTLDEADLKPNQLSGIGIGAPGTIDMDRGVIVEAANLGWYDAPLQQTLEEEFNCPVVVANDVDAGVYGEYRFGAAQGARCVVGIFPGTGIGGGAVYEGAILRGHPFSCMEIGHVEVVHHGRMCGCGREGCLETEASRLAIGAAAAKAAYRGEAPHLREEAGADLSKIRSGALAASIKAGDTAVEQIVRRAAGFIGTAAANIVNLLAPDCIVLGGGMVEAMPELFVSVVEEVARKRAMPTYAKHFRVTAARLGDDAAVLGAAGWVEKNVAGQPPAAATVAVGAETREE